MPLNSFEARVNQNLGAKIQDRINTMAEALLGGGARNKDVGATAQAYSESIGYIRALRDVLILCQEVEDELLGRTKSR